MGSLPSVQTSLVIDMKTQMSRFQIHDDLTAPEGSEPVLRGAMLAAVSQARAALLASVADPQ